MALTRKSLRNLTLGLAFILPNILGFLGFTVIPLVFSLLLAFTNWDLKLHNMFKPEAHLKFVGITNVLRLLAEPDFWKFFNNTLFLMMGIPLGIGASLGAAVLLSRDTKAGGGRMRAAMIASAVLAVSVALLVVTGGGQSAMVILLTGLACTIVLGGVIGGMTVYRTLFYVPSFASGVATYILWKKLYNPQTGPINNALAPLLEGLTLLVRQTPAAVVRASGWVSLGLMLLVLLYGVNKLRSLWREGDLGWRAALAPLVFLLLPVGMTAWWGFTRAYAWPVLALMGGGLLMEMIGLVTRPREFRCAAGEGGGSALMFSLSLMAAGFIFLGLTPVLALLPEAAAQTGGLQPPEWLSNYYWAKPALMIMGFWGSIGSNNMLLYLAALTNVPGELYEAADIDGASAFQKFWNVTWPQLAPTTFFIVVMSVIGGLQGGFDTARVMTYGGPAGATTTLSYYVYTEGFETGRLGYASAVAWTLFVMVFVVTLFNWRMGNRYVND